MKTRKMGLGLVILGAIAFLFSQPANAAIEGAGAWLFDEGSGSIVQDSSSNSITGTLYNSPAWTTDHPSPAGGTGFDYSANRALHFTDTSEQYINLGNPSALNFTNEITFEFWIKPDEGQGQYALSRQIIRNWVVHMSGGGNNTFLTIRNTTNGYEDSGYIMSVGTGVWTHVAMVYSNVNKTGYLYKNGILQGSHEYEAQMKVDGWSTFYIGTYNGSISFLSGTMDEVRILDRALSEDEVYYDSKNSLIPESSSLLYLVLSLPSVFWYLRKRKAQR